MSERSGCDLAVTERSGARRIVRVAERIDPQWGKRQGLGKATLAINRRPSNVGR